MTTYGVAIKLFAGSLVALTLIVSGSNAGVSDIRSRLLTLLSDRHHLATMDEVKSAGQGAVDTLKAIVDDTALPLYQRIRATLALGYYSDDNTSAFLRKTVIDQNGIVALRSAALTALARSSASDESVEFIARYLNDDDQLVRGSAIGALKVINTDSALRALPLTPVNKNRLLEKPILKRID